MKIVVVYIVSVFHYILKATKNIWETPWLDIVLNLNQVYFINNLVLPHDLNVSTFEQNIFSVKSSQGHIILFIKTKIHPKSCVTIWNNNPPLYFTIISAMKLFIQYKSWFSIFDFVFGLIGKKNWLKLQWHFILNIHSCLKHTFVTTTSY